MFFVENKIFQISALVRDSSKIRDLQNKRETVYNEFERACHYLMEHKKRLLYRKGKVPILRIKIPGVGKQVDAIDHFYKKLCVLDNRIKEILLPLEEKKSNTL